VPRCGTLRVDRCQHPRYDVDLSIQNLTRHERDKIRRCRMTPNACYYVDRLPYDAHAPQHSRFVGNKMSFPPPVRRPSLRSGFGTALIVQQSAFRFSEHVEFDYRNGGGFVRSFLRSDIGSGVGLIAMFFTEPTQEATGILYLGQAKLGVRTATILFYVWSPDQIQKTRTQ